MNWPDYTRLVGSISGAPLAMAGLAAFFLESTFLVIFVLLYLALAVVDLLHGLPQ